MGRIVGGIILVVGLWVFLFPFVGPVFGLPLAGMAAGGQMGMTAMGKSPMVMLNEAMVFSNFIPGMVLSLIGIYHLFQNRPAFNAS